MTPPFPGFLRGTWDIGQTLQPVLSHFLLGCLPSPGQAWPLSPPWEQSHPLQGLLGWDAGISGCPTLLTQLFPGGEWSPEFLNGEGPVRNFMNGESSEEVQAP